MPGKLDVVIGFHEDGARAARLAVMFEQSGRVQFASVTDTLDILVSGSCRQLGTYVASGGSVTPELHHRIQATWETVRAHAGSFYTCAEFDPEVKARTVQPLLLSRLLTLRASGVL
jgi:hypothetical protein